MESLPRTAHRLMRWCFPVRHVPSDSKSQKALRSLSIPWLYFGVGHVAHPRTSALSNNQRISDLQMRGSHIIDTT